MENMYKKNIGGKKKINNFNCIYCNNINNRKHK